MATDFKSLLNYTPSDNSLFSPNGTNPVFENIGLGNSNQSDYLGSLGNFMFGSEGSQGNLGSTLGGLGGIFSAYNGAKQLGLAEDSLNFKKDAFNTNLSNQARLVNTRLNDRQRARIGGTGNNNANGTYQSLAEYKAQSNVSGKPIK